MTPFLFSLFTFISTLCGGLFGIRHKEKIHLIISFTAGVLLSVCFFEIIPEMFEAAAQYGIDSTYALIALVVGFLFIHILEKAAIIHHTHAGEEGDHRHPLLGYVGASGLAFHSFLDGIGIGLGFQVDPQVGFLVALAVIAHDFSDGLNTVSYMLLNKHTIKKAIFFLLIDAIAPLVGVLVTYLVPIPGKVLVVYLGFFAGFLLYIGASDLLPEAHSKKSSWLLVGLTVAGAVFIFLVTRFV